MDAVEIKDVVKRYGSQISVDHLRLSVRQGEILGLLGPNGAGKSTTINMICGLLSIDQGDIRIGGISIREQPLQAKRRIGLVPQDLAIYEGLSARENVTFFGQLYGLRGQQLKEQVSEALEFVGLADRQRDRPPSFSGGMKRRLNIACAIMHRPELIIMDEPTVGIDPHSRNHILESVKRLNEQGSTIVYTSHYMEEVSSLCHRIAILDRGQLIACGTQAELRTAVSQDEKITIQASQWTEAAIEELRRHPRIRTVTAEERSIDIYLPSSQPVLQDILFVLSKHDVAIQSLARSEPDLESLFLTLTGRTLRD